MSIATDLTQIAQKINTEIQKCNSCSHSTCTNLDDAIDNLINSSVVTIKTATAKATRDNTSLSFTVTSNPTFFVIVPSANLTVSTTRYIGNIVRYSASSIVGLAVTRSTAYYNTNYSSTYSNGSLTVNSSGSTTGGYFRQNVNYTIYYI